MSNYRSETLGNIAKALSSFQSQVETIKKNKEVEVTMKTGGKYKYVYADQGTIFEGIKKLLGEFGLSYSQIIHENGSKLITVLMHESGEWLQSEITLMMTGDIKSYGGDVTYKRRYALSAILGLATEDDDDGEQAPQQQTPRKKDGQQEQHKIELTPESRAWANAVKSYQEHGNLDKVKQHMDISEENEQRIIEESNQKETKSDEPY